MEEFLPIINEVGEILGKSTRKECHSGKMLLHPVVHLHIFKRGGFILLQKRPSWKDIQPGKWDTAVGGHVDYGETIEEALLREANEELGLSSINPIKITQYIYRSEIEQEMINVYYVLDTGQLEINFNSDEIDDVKFWHIDEIMASIGKGILTPNFEKEFNKIKHLIL